MQIQTVGSTVFIALVRQPVFLPLGGPGRGRSLGFMLRGPPSLLGRAIPLVAWAARSRHQLAVPFQVQVFVAQMMLRHFGAQSFISTCPPEGLYLYMLRHYLLGHSSFWQLIDPPFIATLSSFFPRIATRDVVLGASVSF